MPGNFCTQGNKKICQLDSLKKCLLLQRHLTKSSCNYNSLWAKGTHGRNKLVLWKCRWHQIVYLANLHTQLANRRCRSIRVHRHRGCRPQPWWRTMSTAQEIGIAPKRDTNKEDMRMEEKKHSKHLALHYSGFKGAKDVQQKSEYNEHKIVAFIKQICHIEKLLRSGRIFV